jgi:hypothetical protein
MGKLGAAPVVFIFCHDRALWFSSTSGVIKSFKDGLRGYESDLRFYVPV